MLSVLIPVAGLTDITGQTVAQISRDELLINLTPILWFLLATYLFYTGSNAFQGVPELQNKRTENIEDVSVGETAIEGTVKPVEETIRHPFSNQECVYLDWHVKGVKSTFIKKTYYDGDQGVPFFLQDDTGSIRIENPSNAEAELYKPTNTFGWKMLPAHNTPQEILDFFEWAGIDQNPGKNAFYTDFHLETLPVDDWVSVIGEATVSDAGLENSENESINEPTYSDTRLDDLENLIIGGNEDFRISDSSLSLLQDRHRKAGWKRVGAGVICVGIAFVFLPPILDLTGDMQEVPPIGLSLVGLGIWAVAIIMLTNIEYKK